jgi:bacillopeptidase F (M6 metalloprotease family)
MRKECKRDATIRVLRERNAAQTKTIKVLQDLVDWHISEKGEWIAASTRDNLSRALAELKKDFDDAGMPLTEPDLWHTQAGMLNKEYLMTVYNDERGYQIFHEGQASVVGQLEYWLKQDRDKAFELFKKEVGYSICVEKAKEVSI